MEQAISVKMFGRDNIIDAVNFKMVGNNIVVYISGSKIPNSQNERYNYTCAFTKKPGSSENMDEFLYNKIGVDPSILSKIYQILPSPADSCFDFILSGKDVTYINYSQKKIHIINNSTNFSKIKWCPTDKNILVGLDVNNFLYRFDLESGNFKSKEIHHKDLEDIDDFIFHNNNLVICQPGKLLLYNHNS
jgi:hypothetical protein